MAAIEAADGERWRLVVEQSLFTRNDERAADNRRRFRDRGLLVLNVLSSPGSGKTALLERTLRDLAPGLRGAVIVGDLATERDAERLHAAGVDVVQINTGSLCHLEAGMVGRAADALDLDALDLLAIENVGNLVCPANYDLGEDLRVVLLSVVEGEDKPLKYPVVFARADVVVVSKTDLAGPAGFDRDTALAHLRRAAPQAVVFELSARTGEGLQHWYDFLRTKGAGRTPP